MEPKLEKTNSSFPDTSSPILLRRRLSAPETVMRKYRLERARSQEKYQNIDSRFDELSISHSGSDLNLRKKDSSIILRKSTILRRLINNSSTKTLSSSSFQEWQHYCGKLSTPSLNSLQGSPEHVVRKSLIGYETKTSPKHVVNYANSRRISPIRTNLQHSIVSPKRKVESSPQKKLPVRDSAYSNSTGSTQKPFDENRNHLKQECASTQTASTTNLNVISNVKLSQKTLDLIVNEVMKDVQKVCNNNRNGNVETVRDQKNSIESVHVRKIPDCALGKSPGERQDYKLDGNYSLTNDSPRLSAFSMSKLSMGNTEDVSETLSLTDSLDDAASSNLRNNHIHGHDNKPVRGDLPPLQPKEKKRHFKSPDAFFVPMKSESVQDDAKSVSEYFPEKFKEKLTKRQVELREKLLQQSKYPTRQLLKGRPRKKSVKNESNEKKKSTILPKIDTKRTESKRSNKKRNNAVSESEHFRLYKTENEYFYDSGPKRIHHDAFELKNSCKRIEILEIMECIDYTKSHEEKCSRSKSKIPVPLPQKPRFLNPLPKRPTYLDFDKVVITDRKLDQLIANILIQSLHEKTNRKRSESNGNPNIRSRENVNETLNQSQTRTSTTIYQNEGRKAANSNANESVNLNDEKSKKLVATTTTSGKWSIVVCGNGDADFASDLEMKIRFPRSNQRGNFAVPSSRNSYRMNRKILDEHNHNFIFDRRGEISKNVHMRKLPDVHKRSGGEGVGDVGETRKFPDGKVMKLKMFEIPDDVRPRQTKTSLKRYNMTRPPKLTFFKNNFINFRNYPEILSTIPRFLSVTGYPIDPERKCDDPIVTERKDKSTQW